MYAVTISRVVMRVRVPRSAFRCRRCALCCGGSSGARVIAGTYFRTPILLGAMAAVAGCGRIGMSPLRDADTQAVDGAVDTPVDALAGPAADACLLGDWMVPADQPFSMVNSPQTDWGVEVSRDGLRLVFSSNRPDPAQQGTNYDVYYAERGTTADGFDDGDPSLTSDGRHLVYATTRTTGSPGTSDIAIAERSCQ
ncbi:MAG TPA: hypothetical protein VLM79_04640 [Kofleriaceae bacterium]|nr:hypothetical protein [Kofleriaceae bacterium]